MSGRIVPPGKARAVEDSGGIPMKVTSNVVDGHAPVYLPDPRNGTSGKCRYIAQTHDGRVYNLHYGGELGVKLGCPDLVIEQMGYENAWGELLKRVIVECQNELSRIGQVPSDIVLDDPTVPDGPGG